MDEDLTLLKWYFDMGVEDIGLKVKTPNRDEVTSSLPNSNQLQNILDNCSSLTELKDILLSFEGCDLKRTATNTVFSEGVEDSEIMLMGEAPGAKEDEAGRPFCGESGKLLDLMLKAIDLSRHKNCYITNSIFWRPPANRKPTSEEIAICRPFVEKHIELFAPKLLILVGATAVESVLGIKSPMSHLRTKPHIFKHAKLGDIKTVVIFHPAYLLRQPLQKREMWIDLLFIQNLIEQTL
jgi:uracil-DNA glycosylase family 4